MADGLPAQGDLAVDSMRLRARASTKAVQTLSRSKKRLAELAAVDESARSPVDREAQLCQRSDGRAVTTVTRVGARVR